jgi:hypothetical protein
MVQWNLFGCAAGNKSPCARDKVFHDKNSCAFSDASECTSDGSAILSMTKRMDNSKRCSRSKMMMTKERTCC